ncbi:accessory Sec system S-layer assembly protein [Bacillus sp. AGMB 02131]|uniref:Accessory Sec system S-layer assembly protein n=1 Tax=Peribacillus faecalis TaxID=2772559 RepID=A0A927CVE5_9BACI|nr:accessory Sec system S-layer assembly protein [Peribacillus faecalis]MBD3108513.1 accessory Sec system S-layer assembly protein [Peribacillus faecalis]
MFSIFRKSKKMKNEGKDSAFSSKELINTEDDHKKVDVNEDIETALSLHASWALSAEQTYVYRFLNNELAPLKPNQISLAGTEMRREGDDLLAIAFVRNSLSKAIKFEKVTLLLLDVDQQPIARHEFDMSQLGELPGRSSRPWQFIFPKNSIIKQEFSTTDWSIAFEIKQKHKLDLEESWNTSLSTEDKEKLKKIVDDLTPPKEGEVNFMGLQAHRIESGDLHVTVLIRNGSSKTINLQLLPLEIHDASKKVIAKGGFQLDNLQVVANTTKPWTFIFPAALVTEKEIDLKSWTISTVCQ